MTELRQLAARWHARADELREERPNGWVSEVVADTLDAAARELVTTVDRMGQDQA